MDESSKSKKFWGDLERSVLQGKGIDIGCGLDLVVPDARPFDLIHGDANVITQYVDEQFDFVYASHCLEHMHDPRKAILEWWQLVKVGGHLFFAVPDEDLYEQGVFPSRFNDDHKATFTISKTKSWSDKSVNVLDLAQSLPGGQIVRLALQDIGYDRSIMKHGSVNSRFANSMLRLIRGLRRRTGMKMRGLERYFLRFTTVDQTRHSDTAVAQIQCIVKKII